VPEQRPDDLLAGAHDGVAAAGGMASAMAGDAADARLFREVAVSPPATVLLLGVLVMAITP
jgi:hypothetical protein